jgi:hypothetical protein
MRKHDLYIFVDIRLQIGGWGRFLMKWLSTVPWHVFWTSFDYVYFSILFYVLTPLWTFHQVYLIVIAICRYAREDTHYLLYIYDLMRSRLVKESSGENDNLLEVNLLFTAIFCFPFSSCQYYLNAPLSSFCLLSSLLDWFVERCRHVADH